MDNYTATMIVEGVEEATEEEIIESWQHLINVGLVWILQGRFGRTASQLIDEGICTN